MKQLIILFSIMLFSKLSYSQTSYNLYELTVLQYDSILFSGRCEHQLVLNDSIIRLTQDESTIDFYSLTQPDSDGWQDVKSYAKYNKPAYHYNLRINYYDDYFKDKLLFSVDGVNRVLYHIIIETNEPVNNNIRYAYKAYIN